MTNVGRSVTNVPYSRKVGAGIKFGGLASTSVNENIGEF